MAKSLSLLLIEDNQNNAQSLLHSFREAGYDVTFKRVTTREEFKNALYQNNWEIIVSEWKLKCFHCIDAISALKESCLNIPLFVVSDKASEAMIVETIKAGAADFIMRDNIKRLFSSVEQKLSEKNKNNIFVSTGSNPDRCEPFLEYIQCIIEGLPDPAYAKGLDCKYLLVNNALSEMTGKSKEETIGKDDFFLFPPDEANVLIENDKKILNAGEPVTSEELLTTSTGKKKFFLSTKKPLRDKNGNLMGIFGISRDITERKLIEGELKAERKKFISLTEHAPFGMAIIDSKGTYNYINSKFTEIFGYTLNDVPNGKVWFKLAYPDKTQRKKVIAIWKEYFKDFIPGEREARTFSITCSNGAKKIVRITPVLLGTGEYIVTFEDITAKKQFEDKLAFLATHDELTGLPNRRSLEESLARSIAHAKRGSFSSLMYMDIDNFKIINDTMGHTAGDELLIQFAGLLQNELRAEDIIFRLGGDEFAVIMDHTTISNATNIGERLRIAVSAHHFLLNSTAFPITISIGLIEIDGKLGTMELLSRADMAMYASKNKGRNKVAVYRSEDNIEIA